MTESRGRVSRSAFGRRNGYYVVISGAPASGKSTLAVPLADALGLPLISFDVIKESIADHFLGETEEWSNQLGNAVFDAFLAVAADAPVAILEAWWRDDRPLRLLNLDKPIIEIFCHCNGQRLEQRARIRAAENRHPIHRDAIDASVMNGLAAFSETVKPMSIGGPVLNVDTTNPVDVAMVAKWVRSQTN